jgi:hypothetical protein
MGKWLTKVFLSSLLILFSFASAYAVSITFTPTPIDIGDLDHSYYYAWVIKGWDIPVGEVIEKATLTIYNLNDWTNENGDHLYIHLIDGKPSGGSRVVTGGNTWKWSDNQGGGDNWVSWPKIGDYEDISDAPEKVTYSFKNLGLLDELTNYIRNDTNHKYSIGFDPDCHYYNTGVEFTIDTKRVPEPRILLLLGSGLLSFIFFIRRRKQ